MPFDPKNPNAWIDEITVDDPLFIRTLCKCLYHERTLVRWPAHALLCRWGMTAEGRIGLPEDPREFVVAMPSPDRVLSPGDEHYALLVREEDPAALEPGPANSWPFAVAAFRRCGGVVPVAAPEGCAWNLVHLYDRLTRLVVGNPVDSQRAGRHFTQAAALVALHGAAHAAKRQYATVESVLRAKVFATFNYDPLYHFAPDADHDNCGFVIKP